MRRRENTFRIDYANVPKKPSYNEVHQFIGSMLGLKQEQVKRVQCSRSLGCAFVKVSDLATAQKVVEEHSDKHEVVVDEKSYPLRIMMEDGAVDVKLSDLSEDVTDEKIVEFMASYGDVLSIHELMWGENYLFGGIPTGIRVVRMLVKTNIPSFVTIDGEVTNVTYFGQRQTCRHCGDFVHNGVSCVQNKKLLVQKLTADQTKTTYANVTKQPKSAGTKLAGTKTTEPMVISRPTLLPKKLGAIPKSRGTDSNSSLQPRPIVFKTRNAPQPDQTPTIDVTLMPPPAFPDPMDCEMTTVPTLVATEAADGEESDESSASVSSKSSRGRRPLGKKQKTEHGANAQYEKQ